MYKIIFVLCCLISTHCLGQNAGEKRKLYRAVIENTYNKNYKGVLYAPNDSTISLTNIRVAKNKAVPGEHEVLVIPIRTIERIKTRRVGALGTGLIVGALVGALGGLLIAVVSNTPCPPNTPYGCMEIIPARLSGAMGFLGGSVGIALGSKSKKFNIRGSRENYNILKERLQPYVYVPAGVQETIIAPAGD